MCSQWGVGWREGELKEISARGASGVAKGLKP